MCLKIDISLKRRSAECYCATREEREVLRYDLLYGHLVLAVLDIIVAEYLHAALVEVCGTQRPRAIQRDIVACPLVHDKPQSVVCSGMDEEVHADVRPEIVIVVILRVCPTCLVW